MNMVTYFNRKDLVSFGSYMTSEKRKASIELKHQIDVDANRNPIPIEVSLRMVHHEDVENWLYNQKSKKG